jgi:hypothetical protein
MSALVLADVSAAVEILFAVGALGRLVMCVKEAVVTLEVPLVTNTTRVASCQRR